MGHRDPAGGDHHGHLRHCALCGRGPFRGPLHAASLCPRGLRVVFRVRPPPSSR